MKILINNKIVTIKGNKFDLNEVSANVVCDGVCYDVLENEKYIEMTNDTLCIHSEKDGLKIKWEIKAFEKSLRLRLNADDDNGRSINSMNILTASVSEYKSLRVLKVPFDNDDWVRYTTSPMTEGGRSYGVGAFFNIEYAAAIGAVDYSVWKTGIDFGEKVSVTAGIADTLTRDKCVHRSVYGSAQAPEVWIFEENSQLEAMERFAQKYSECNEIMKWQGNDVRGWNSWYAYMEHIDADKYNKAVDFISNLDNMRNAYVNFDSFWTNLTEEELLQCVDKARNAGIVPGIYLAPFATWISDEQIDNEVTDCKGNVFEGGVIWRDILLKDEAGKVLPRVDGGLSLDMTHNVSLKLMENSLEYLKGLGFKYIKIDFLGHGAREGDFANKTVHTGLQCYNAAMKKINEIWSGDDMFISLSIAPIFPGGMGHARRVCCDVFGEMKDSEYLLNSLTYGWWINKAVYDFNDPDHICVDKGDAEAKFRFISGVIGGGIFLISSKTEDEESNERIRKMTEKDELMELVAKQIVFRPVEKYIENDVAMMFVGKDEKNTYVAVFNFSDFEKKFDLGELGIDGTPTDLYTKTVLNRDFMLKARDCTIVRI